MQAPLPSPSVRRPSVRPSVHYYSFICQLLRRPASLTSLSLALPKQAAALEVDLLFRRSRYVTSKFMAFPLSFSFSLSLSPRLAQRPEQAYTCVRALPALRLGSK